ncbi:MAG: EamA family transporter [Actinomycetales bacterium]
MIISWGPVLALLSSLVWGTSDFGGGLASKRAGALHVVAYSQAAGLVVIAVAAVVTGAYTAPLDYLPWAALAAVSGAGGLVCFYSALASGRMGVVAPIAALGVLVPVLVGLAQGERPGVLQLLGAAAGVVGVVMAAGPELSGGTGARPVLLAVCAALGFGVALASLGMGAQTSSVMTVLGMRVVSVLSFALILSRIGNAAAPRGTNLLLTLAVGVGDVTANLLFSVATTMGMLSLTSVLGSMYPLATVLLARIVLGERLSRLQQVGVAIGLTGVVLIAAG